MVMQFQNPYLFSEIRKWQKYVYQFSARNCSSSLLLLPLLSSLSTLCSAHAHLVLRGGFKSFGCSSSPWRQSPASSAQNAGPRLVRQALLQLIGLTQACSCPALCQICPSSPCLFAPQTPGGAPSFSSSHLAWYLAYTSFTYYSYQTVLKHVLLLSWLLSQLFASILNCESAESKTVI